MRPLAGPALGVPPRRGAGGGGLERIARVGTVVSAVVASACCWLPLVLAGIGVSGLAVSATFERYRPLFVALAFLFLGVAFDLTYRPRRAAAPDAAAGPEGEACCAPGGRTVSSRRRANRVMLWVAAAVALAFVFFPSYVGTRFGGPGAHAAAGGGETRMLGIRGMTCEGCAVAIEKALQAVPGVRSASVSYAEGRAVVVLDADRPASAETLRKAVADAGYEVVSIGP